MKKLLYLLCMLTFVACNKDNDNKPNEISDFDKPFTSIPKSELKEMLQDFWQIDTIICDYEEGQRMDVMRPIIKAQRHYNVNINFDNDIIRSTTRTTPVENKFTGMRLTWNPEKHALDTTIDAEGVLEVLIPYSLTDDSRNDLRIVANVEQNDKTKFEITYYRDGQLIMSTKTYLNEGTIEYMEENIPPYFFSYKSSFKTITRSDNALQSLELTIRKEGGPSLFQSINIEDGNMLLLTEYNNLRARAIINEYDNIQNLMDLLEDNDKFDELALEILKKNMSAVIVFKDRDEKIGDLELSIDEDDNLPLICRFQDGEEFKLPLIFLDLIE